MLCCFAQYAVNIIYGNIFVQNPECAVQSQTISIRENSGWAMPTQIISSVGTRPPCPPSAGAHAASKQATRLVLQKLRYEPTDTPALV